MDASLVEVSKDLSHVPPALLTKLDEEPEASPACPLDSTAADDIKIPCAGALDDRLRLIHRAESPDGDTGSDATPEIRLEGTPEIRLEATEDEVDLTDALLLLVDDDLEEVMETEEVVDEVLEEAGTVEVPETLVGGADPEMSP